MKDDALDAVMRGFDIERTGLDRAEWAAYRVLRRACDKAGEPRWNEDRFIEARCLARLMLRTKLRAAARAYLAEWLPKFHVRDWRCPEDSHARARFAERLATRAEIEDWLKKSDPARLIARPKDEQGWDRMIDRWIELERDRTR